MHRPIMMIVGLGGLAAVAALALRTHPAAAEHAAAEHAAALPAPAVDVPPSHMPQTAILAGGCYWGMEAVFEQVKGVTSVVSGFDSGDAGGAGRVEAVKITYDPRRISYGTLLRIYFSVAHDPTQVNGQGPDRGPRYRSAIFPQSAAQKKAAAAYIAQLSAGHVFAAPIVTRIEGGTFHPVGADQQDFYRKNPNHPYIVRWDKPKIAAFRAAFPTLAA